MKKSIHSRVCLMLLSSTFIATANANAQPRFIPVSDDLISAMESSIETVGSTSLTQANNTLSYVADAFGASIECLSGWQNVSAEYNHYFDNNANYFYCQGDVLMTTAIANAPTIEMDAEHLLIASNGHFFGQLSDLPSLPFGGVDRLATELGESSISFAIAKGAIIEQFSDLAVGLPEQRLMAYFSIEVGAGNSMAISDAIEVSSGESAYLSLVLDWQDPMYYIESDIFTQGPFDDLPFKPTAMGLSWHGRLGFDAEFPLWNGETWQGADFSNTVPKKADNFDQVKYTQTGHVVLAGEVDFSPWPITLSGLINTDLDSNNDGFGGGNGFFDTVEKKITEITSDTKMTANGTLSLGLGNTALELSIDLARASLALDTAKKQFSYWGESVQFFDGGSDNWITKVLSGIQTPQLVAFGLMDVDQGEIKRFDQSFAANIKHNGFLLKGKERLSINIPETEDGLSIDGTVGYLGVNLPFKLHVSASSCRDFIEQVPDFKIAGYTVNNLTLNLCKAVQSPTIPVDASILFAGQQLVFAGLTAQDQIGNLSAGAQSFNLTGGKLEANATYLKNTGIELGNAVAKYGNKAKTFSMGVVKGLGNGFAEKLSNWSVNGQLSTGKIDLGSTGKISSQYFKITGDGRFAVKVKGNGLSAPYSANLKVEYCAKFLGKKDCKTDSLPSLSGNLDLDGCYKTPKLSKSLKILGKKIKFSIPARKMCMF